MENNEPKQPQGKTYDGGVTEEQINKGGFYQFHFLFLA